MSEIEYLSLKDYLVFSCVWLYLQDNIQQDIRRIIFVFCVFFKKTDLVNYYNRTTSLSLMEDRGLFYKYTMHSNVPDIHYK